MHSEQEIRDALDAVVARFRKRYPTVIHSYSIKMVDGHEANWEVADVGTRGPGVSNMIAFRQELEAVRQSLPMITV